MMIKTDEELIWESYNTSKIVKENITGEYWIDDYGSATYADGDYGDMNHEMIVSQNITSELLNYFDIEFDMDAPTNFNYLSDEIDNTIYQFVLDNNILKDDGITDPYEVFMDEKYKLMEKYLKTLNIENLDAKLKVAHDQMDAREYGLQYDNWKRVHGNWIETWYFRPQDLNIIVNGVNDILEQEGNENENEKFNIEVRSTRTTFEDIPLDVLFLNKIKSIIPYRSSY